ncbi:hypothetical protein C8E89_106173 [Mycolicibacterium moriokaense]|uniref:Uncharacterized protein n=1 Tax=Mycolicibacterium moriokaense TaxID=39691 RepID=A0A318HLJ8_9MYCO|nr:hypothetical protein C8E89_106173 [Mycolicibacterium moriokaense]
MVFLQDDMAGPRLAYDPQGKALDPLRSLLSLWTS